MQDREAAAPLVVYEHYESVCCQKVAIVLAEKGVDHESRYISLEKGAQKSPDFLAINPKGVVPAIVHGGRVITESSIILEYLDDSFAQPPLMAKDPYWRSRRRLWARWIDDEMHIPHISTISFNIAFSAAMDARDVDAPRPDRNPNFPDYFYAGIDSDPMRKSLAAYQRFIQAMDDALAGSSWLAGPAFSLADIDVVPYIWRLKNLHLSGLWCAQPRIAAWLDRVTARASFKAGVIDREIPSLIAAMRQKGEQAWPQIESMLETA